MLVLILATLFLQGVFQTGAVEYAADLQNTPGVSFQHGQFSEYAYQRSGNPSNGHMCDRITGVPRHLTFITRYNHYWKYTHAYGIPIVSTSRVSDAALKRACYVLRFLLADKYKIRYYLYKHYGRVGIVASNEGVTTIPEHRHLGSWWDTRARGLGGTMQIPISTGAEENLLCWSNDRYSREDIFLHEFSHGIQEIAIIGGAIPGFIARLQRAYNNAKYRRLWANTYSMSTWKEYFAEGVQSFFQVNDYANPANGVHGPVNTRAKLRSYDITLYNLIREVFPCGNTFKDRCDKSGRSFPFRMDCDNGGGGRTPPPVATKAQTSGAPVNGSTIQPPITQPSVCQDNNQNCASWAARGECTKNPTYMKVHCKKSCNTDSNVKCPSWTAKGECQRNPQYMLVYCMKSCNNC